jgi:hypothetical protein
VKEAALGGFDAWASVQECPLKPFRRPVDPHVEALLRESLVLVTLVHDHVALTYLDHVLELVCLVARRYRETVSLTTNAVVGRPRHEDATFASLRSSALALEVESLL